MAYNAGDYPVDHTDVEIPFNTFTSNDPAASSTITELATTDIHIHKDGSVTQRTSAAGFTLTLNMDGITGNHLLQIDLSDNTDVGFYAAGHEYTVRIEGTVVDAGTINAWIGAFSIERAGGVLALIKGGSITVGTCTTNTDMRGTNNAALASVLGALDNAAAAGEVTDADTIMAYIKQLINILIGAAGIGTFPAEAGPGDGVSLAKVIRAIHADVTGLNGAAMRGTDGANATVPDAAGTAAALHAISDAIAADILAMLDDPRGEPGQATPPVNPDAMTKIDYLYKQWRNKKDNDGSTRNLYADDGTTVDQKSTVGEAAGIVTVGEVTTGP